ncbi:molybdopterin cofactor-binding domain-containing protein [Roseibium sp. SCPC15]|uniref:xanthine dehydrogenase family protein molybdopterin-binding subunit n=1 Tax=Roseibium sp. SCP15 TaxID=3141376 RepID=UPI0033384E8A
MSEITVFSRRGFLASGAALGGGLIVAAFASNPSLAETTLRDDADTDGNGFAPNAFIEITSDGQVTLTVGKSEMGQGTQTGIAQLIADELGCSWGSISVVQAKSAPIFGFPFNGFMITGGSSGLRSEWTRMRKMGAAARMMLEQAAANKWSVDIKTLSVAEGVVAAPDGRRATFASLVSDASKLPVPDDPSLKSAGERSVIGRLVKRLDTNQKTTGQAVYGIDVRIPNMVTAVVISAPQFQAPVQTFDAERALARPGVIDVLSISTGVAIVADHFWAAHSASEDVDIVWGRGPFAGIDMDDLRDGYRRALDTPGKIAEATGDGEAVVDGRRITREFEQPYLAHACMEPMNFTVSIGDGVAEVWGPTQAQSLVQSSVGKIAGIDPENVTVHTTFLGGGFGRRSAQDFIEAATEIAMATGRPVQLIYSREDDMRAGRYRAFNLTRATGTLDKVGEIAALDIKIAKPSVSKWSRLPFLIRDDGVDEQAVEGLVNLPYDIPNTRIEWIDHDPGLPVHFWRAVGASHNPFVVESLIDDLAHVSGQDPLGLRRKLLRSKPRHLAVLDKLADEAGWSAPINADVGRGVALVTSFESIVGEVAEVQIVDGELHVHKVTCVIDCGVAVNPGQVEAQMHSSIVFGLSAFLRGEITLSDGEIDQSNFHDYEPLRLPEMPQINVSILEGAEEPGGVGEPGLPPLLPAVANAVFSLTGERVTQLPFRP